MQRVNRSTAVAQLPAAPAGGKPGYFAKPDPVGGVPATNPGYEWYNAIQEELASVIEGAGLTLDGTKFNQAFQAIRRIAQKSVILADTGAVNAYAATNSPAFSKAADLADGLVQQVRIATTNNGASTYSPDGIANDPILGLALQPLQGGELVANGVAVLFRMTMPAVNAGKPFWLLMECAGGAQQVAPATQSQHALTLGQANSLFVAASRLGNLNGSISVTGTITLPAASLGSLVEITSGSNVTITLPSTTGSAGGGYPIYNNTASAVTIAAAAGQNCNIGRTNVSSFTIQPGGNAFVYTDGASWEVLGEAQLPASSLFGASITSPGYQKLPSGLIIQWGVIPAIGASAAVNVTYPLAFPNNVLSVVPGSYATAYGQAFVVGVNPNGTGNSKAAFTAYNSSNLGATNASNYIAFGY